MPSPLHAHKEAHLMPEQHLLDKAGEGCSQLYKSMQLRGEQPHCKASSHVLLAQLWVDEDCS